MSRALQINSSPQGWMARNTKPVPLAEKGWVITMKKISIILLSAVLVFSMAACNGGKEKADNQTEKQTESVKPTEEAEMANHKIFSVVAKALKNGGKHFMDIMNGSYAQTHFPCKLWDAGEKGLTLSAFEWEKDRKTLIYGQVDYMYGEALYKPEMKEGNPIRLYSLDEITEIFGKLGLRICNSFADFSGKPSSDNDIQLMVYSIRE